MYKHFGDRSGLARALAEEFVRGLLTELGQALQPRCAPASSCAPRSTRTSRSSTRPAGLPVPVPVRHQLDGAARGAAATEPADTLTGVIREISRQVALLLGEQLRAAGLDSGPAEPWAFGIVGMVHLAGDWWVERHTMSRDRLVDYLAGLLWDGMAGWGTPSAPMRPRSRHRVSSAEE